MVECLISPEELALFSLNSLNFTYKYTSIDISSIKNDNAVYIIYIAQSGYSSNNEFRMLCLIHSVHLVR